MTARQFANTCPDCDRWRCVCDDDAIEAGDPAQLSNALGAYRCTLAAAEKLVADREAAQANPVRTGPPPPAIRERLAQLRAECAAHLASLGRRP